MSGLSSVIGRGGGGFGARYGGAIHWFPGHMAKATAGLTEVLPRCDVVIEVRDARVPFTSANGLLAHVIATASNAPSLHHVVVCNKADLANPQLQSRVHAAICSGVGTHSPALKHCLFTTAARLRNVSALLGLVDALPSRADRFRTAGKTMIVVGAPNVGKSTLLNAFRQHATGVAGGGGRGGSTDASIARRGAATGSIPGVTRSISTFLVRRQPPLYMFDSPGIMPPRLATVDDGMKLVVTHVLPEHHVPRPVQAEYLLHHFHAMGTARYVHPLRLARPYHPDEVQECLTALAAAHNLRASGEGGKVYAGAGVQGWDIDAAATLFVRKFNEGALGRYTLDEVPPLPAR